MNMKMQKGEFPEEYHKRVCAHMTKYKWRQVDRTRTEDSWLTFWMKGEKRIIIEFMVTADPARVFIECKFLKV